MTTAPAPTVLPPAGAERELRQRIVPALAVAFGALLTFCMQGYQFGKSNHTVYLIDALRHVHPALLANDWFATQTLQYHAAFGWITRGLMRLGIIEPVFLLGYLALLVLLHAAWWRIVVLLGGGVAASFLSEVFFHISGGGTGLGMYQILQDSAFLPSNISAVALLWGLMLHLADRRAASAVVFGIAGLFHLNYAIVAPIIWIALIMQARRKLRTKELIGLAGMTLLCAANIIPALLVTLRQSGRMPLEEFVALYVRLRHSHHYDPLSWPIALWVSFIWPIPLAWLCWRRVMRDEADARTSIATREAARTVGWIMLLLGLALMGAGIWFVSETLVQLSLWRFSVFVKLLTCVGAAAWIERAMRDRRALLAGASLATGAILIAACLVRGPYLGLYRVAEDAPSYLAACDWIAANTPVDAVFLVPPDEQAFRLRARRAIVVNLKSVPQLSGELDAWRQRLSQVLMLPDLTSLPRPFGRTLAAIRERYDSRTPEQLQNVARRYGARYVLVAHRWPDRWEARRVKLAENDAWFLYDLAEAPAGEVPAGEVSPSEGGAR